MVEQSQVLVNSNNVNTDDDEEGRHRNRRQTVAIIGGGVSGLAAAWHLHTQAAAADDTNTYNADVVVFEASDRLGGHAHTLTIPNTTNHDATATADADAATTVDVDIGFMVYNDTNYPNMVRWFQSMGIQEQLSDMSLSVSLNDGKHLEWSSDGLNGLFAKRSQLVSPAFYQCLTDMVRFHTEAAALLNLTDDDPRKMVTTGQFLKDHQYTDAFCSYYLLPMMAALWSASMKDVLQFPASQLISFLSNHKMLQLMDRPQVRKHQTAHGTELN
jgi:cyclopropane-fatty-acyl-phospholipid synthase